MIVYVMEIKHEHGSNIDVFATYELAENGVAEYCLENWTHGMGKKPKKKALLIERYFEQADSGWDDPESWEIHEREVVEK